MLPILLVAAIAWTLTTPVGAQTTPGKLPADLSGTSWQFVKFQGGDDRVLTPDDPDRYTVAFGANGRVSVRFDCNRGRGTWKSSGPNQLRFGPLALTRAKCPPGSLHDRFVKDWDYVRSYVIRDGHLYLALMADAGIYEFLPQVPASQAKPKLPAAQIPDR